MKTVPNQQAFNVKMSQKSNHIQKWRKPRSIHVHWSLTGLTGIAEMVQGGRKASFLTVGECLRGLARAPKHATLIMIIPYFNHIDDYDIAGICIVFQPSLYYAATASKILNIIPSHCSIFHHHLQEDTLINNTGTPKSIA
jgi:hypothetical protein